LGESTCLKNKALPQIAWETTQKVGRSRPATKTKEQIIREKFAHLLDRGITLTEAAEKYNIPRNTLEAWIYRSKYIGFIDELSYPKKINEAEIAHLAEIYHKRRKRGMDRGGVPLLGENGLPILELKHPELSEYRRRKRKK